MTPTNPPHRTRAASPHAVIALLSAAATLAVVGLVSRYALVSLLLDGLPALLIVGALAGGGLGLLPGRWAHELPLRWRLLLGFALGTGAGSLLVFLLGLAGMLNRPIWLGVLIVATAVGVLRLKSWLAQPREDDERIDPGRSPTYPVWRWLWLLLVPFAAMGVLSAASAPGTIWSEEGFGYDVLGYHLEMPKEYWHQGAIAYAPHNVYASFPAAIEMHYLLAMIVLENDLDTAAVANFIHALFGVLTVFAAWCIARDWSARSGLIAALAMGTANWLWYLSGLAYVELGMIFYALTATGLLLRFPQSKHPRTALIVAGVICGFACGCKYPAVLLMAIPLATACLLLDRGTAMQRLQSGALFALAAGVAFSPWIIKNTVATGNPVFPLADSLFHARPAGWDDASAARWQRGHEPAPNQRAPAARLKAAWDHIVADHYQRFGPILLILGVLGLAGRPRDTTDRVLLGLLLFQWIAWSTLTHLYARFAIIVLVPLALLAGRSVLSAGRARLAMIGTLLTAGASWNLYFAYPLMRDERPLGWPASALYEGRLPEFEYLGVVNNALPDDAKILMLGDARAFYIDRRVDYHVVFNRNPFAEAIRAARGPEDVAAWLHERNYTHVLVHWGEINRLRRSRYGFPAEINTALFAKLVDEDSRPPLRMLDEFRRPNAPLPYATLYGVRPR
ncbi:MAG: ArnT family glycosyltransferase [Phycisphaerae bacterium]